MDLVWKSIGRGWLLRGCVLMSVHPRRSATRDRPDHEAGDCIDDDGYEKEREADLDQRAEVEVAGGLRELARDDAGQRVGGRERGIAGVGGVSDGHGEFHG